jgi:hypothetical protein
LYTPGPLWRERNADIELDLTSRCWSGRLYLRRYLLLHIPYSNLHWVEYVFNNSASGSICILASLGVDTRSLISPCCFPRVWPLETETQASNKSMSRATYLGMVGGFAINFAFLRNKINIWILAIIFLFDQMFIVLA